MQKKSIVELLAEAKALKQKEAELKAQLRAQKQIIAVEYADNLSPEAKAQQIAEAEKILNTAKQKALDLRAGFKAAMKKVREDVNFAKEILNFVNYKQNHSLKKQVNHLSIEGKTLRFNREGLKEITIDISKATWQQDFKSELKKQGLNGDDRVADNIVYKASQMIKAQ